MKSARIWLVLLLAVLLPVRGAVAATMLCPIAGSGSQVELRVELDSSVHQAIDHSIATNHEAAHGAQHEHDGGHHDHAASGQPDKCNMCSAFCSVTPLVNTSPAILPPVDAANTVFPAFSAPAPSFFSDGQERPPRIT
jgi:hypothetical protein